MKVADVEHRRVDIDATREHAYNQVNVRRLRNGDLVAVYNEERFPFHHDTGQTVFLRSRAPIVRRRRSTSPATGIGSTRRTGRWWRSSRTSTSRPAVRCGASGAANVHRALGCVGTITQGAVRDLDALDRLGFHAFATSVSVAHGYGAFVGYGQPVDVAGLLISTGDLLVADRHGVLRIPPEIPVEELCAVARRIDALEAEIFAFSQSDGFSVRGLAELQESVMARWPRPREGARPAGI